MRQHFEHDLVRAASLPASGAPKSYPVISQASGFDTSDFRRVRLQGPIKQGTVRRLYRKPGPV